jgi:NTE family protein
MGADYVIGSNVASGLLPSDKVRNAFQILMQVAFFREAEDNKVEVPQCDIYIPFKMDKFSMGSFSDAGAIINLGMEEGRALYPRLKKLKDSLDAIYGPEPPTPHRLPSVDEVKISSYEVKGTEKTSPDFFTHTMNFVTNQDYSAKRLANMIRQAVGTRYYKRVTYALEAQPDGTAKIIFDVTENPLTFAKLGLHYNRFSGIGVIANLTTRNFFFTNSRSMVSLNIGESMRVRGEHLQYFGRLKNFALIADLQFDRFDVATYTYDKYKQDGLYKQNLFRTGGRFQFSAKRTFSIGVGSRWDWVRYTPTISTDLNFKGSNSWITNFAYIAHNSLDKAVYPRRGVKFDAEAGYVARQSPRIKFIVGDQTIPATDDMISGDSYPRVTANLESYIPFSRRTTGLLNVQGGANFGYEKNVMNEFIVGGLTKTFRNQITFAGIQEGTIYSPSLVALQGGARVMMFSNTYITARANVLFNNLFSKSEYFDYPDFFSGYALTFAYNFALGPLEISAMYCDQTKRVQSYINLGIPF